MAKVAKVAATPGSLPSDSARFCGGPMNAGPTLKRKTPSELRGEQLKRRIAVELVRESAAPSENADVVDSGSNKSQGPKNTKYIDKRLDEVYPARKPNSRLSLLSGKSNFKENQVVQEKNGFKSSFSSRLTPKNQQELNGSKVSVAKAAGCVLRQCETGEKGTQNKFRSVAELSLGSDRFTEQGTVDVDKALKGLAAHETSGSCSPSSSAGKSGDVKSTSLGNYCSEIQIPGVKVPLDFTLKTTMRIVSSSPVDRFHRLFMGGTYNGISSFSLSGNSGNESIGSALNTPASGDSYNFQSWIYPQSSLPASVISVLSSSSGGAEMDFLEKRQLAWEDSFRSLYYMLRKSGCNVFYVCTSQFVVIFTSVEGTGKVKRTCNAFISKSTRGLRSLLKEHDISFTMPLCCSEVEQISREDLVELSEIEKHNLGQAKRFGSMPDVDNSPKSLLAFNGNESVHGLYDFLLNYRSLLTTLSNMDVPVLCSPIPFLNAALSSPQVRCKEIRRIDALQSKGSLAKDGESFASKTGVCYSIEVKDAYLPPWIISSLCAVMGSEGRSFEACFVTDPNTMGLNAALEAVSQKSNSNTDETTGDSQDTAYAFGISAAVVNSGLQSTCLKALKYSNGSYVAALSPV
ncbi:protein downstream neighbor of son homolog isoform X2 [Chenopodium quinoa]|uniref:protein downstream neighbor of son homolog isoform X2 n=1 Tax=Chenopodium quinoa TaxID=63459 RepID=UPI000B78859A|nr:protein downstream neighbor of son homolog isoform X2 [Chenopodium quinoa]